METHGIGRVEEVMEVVEEEEVPGEGEVSGASDLDTWKT